MPPMNPAPTAGGSRVLSGMRPTGALHLGNYHGALRNWVSLQDSHECYFFIADWHALTTDYENPGQLQKHVHEMVVDWLAAGLDPEKCAIFVQSQVPGHAELHLLLSMITPLSWLERVPTYKDQQAQLKEKDLATYGFLGYPLLQTADIIIYNARFVPVGEDQVAHLELSREIVRRFQNFYGELFVEPKPLLTKFARLPGLDNRKMSKSYGNAIDLSDDAQTVQKKVMQMYTDPKRVRADIPGTVEGNPVFMYHDAFNPDGAEVEELKARYRAGTVGDVEVKKKLAAALNAHLDPMRARRAEILSKPSALRDILHEGSRKARVVAQETMARVRAAVRLKYD
jgi:tryptophanyl-tRNA synthetase